MPRPLNTPKAYFLRRAMVRRDRTLPNGSGEYLYSNAKSWASMCCPFRAKNKGRIAASRQWRDCRGEERLAR